MFVETTKMEGEKKKRENPNKGSWFGVVYVSVCLRWDWGKDSRGLQLCQSFLRP